ncbi:MAG: hypothetical protein HC902_02940 [Calothrix sp. SM1_5_4]|nr:hypothetical protein [Calothrix sp. SM1_5_4]
MLQDFCIVHRRKPRVFQESSAPVWSTCLRSLAFTGIPHRGIQIHPDDEQYAGSKAYQFFA